LKPTIGRIVHYWYEKGDARELRSAPALITEVDDPESESSAIGLAVFGSTNLTFYRHVPIGTLPKPAVHSWTWPERAK
jgi:hypothetical protein